MNLVKTILSMGHTLTLEGDKLLFKAKPGTSAEKRGEILYDLRAFKQEVIAYLVSQEKKQELPASALSVAQCGSLDCTGCYAIGPNLNVHPPRSGNDKRRD
jgi:hypothetical protein